MSLPISDIAQLTTPIKINLALHVVGKRNDGYHLLDSLVYFSFEGDVLHYQSSQENQFSVTGSYAKELTNTPNNLVERARQFMAGRYPNNVKPCHLVLDKLLPIASGVGGGSGDAAATIELLRREWAVECNDDDLLKSVVSIGADLPMCLAALLYKKPLRATGIGETLEIIEDACSVPMVLINHGQEISTPEIFKRLSHTNGQPISIDYSALKTVQSLVSVLENTRNDLYEPAHALAPELANVLKTLQHSGALFARMSGSGATCFGIYANKQDADEAAKNIKSFQPDWFVKSVETVGSRHS